MKPSLPLLPSLHPLQLLHLLQHLLRPLLLLPLHL